MQSLRQHSTVLPPANLDDKPKLTVKQEPLRKMERAELRGRHEYVTKDGHRIQIWKRDGKFLARSRWLRKQVGVTLGDNEADAEHVLRRMITEMEDGTFVPGTEARRQPFPTTPVPRHDIRSLANAFLMDREKLKGKNNAQSYKTRLAHALEFAGLAKSKKAWPLASSINRQFAIDYRNFLFAREVTRNGKSGGDPKRMSPKMVQLCLEALRAMLLWAVRPDVRRLPAGHANPFTSEIIGPKPVKDPVRKNPVPVNSRIQMVQWMDKWQLCNLTALLVVPVRFEDVSGAKISDFDLNLGCWNLGTRQGGNDFNKCRMNVQMPLPPELCAILRATVGNRTDGPMFRSRTDWERNKKNCLQFSSPEQFEAMCESAIHKADSDHIGTEQDRKAVIRQFLQECGAVSTDAIGREIRKLYNGSGILRDIRPYDLRAAVTTDMHCADLRHLELRYLTEHSVADILNEYTPVDPVGQMAKYFQAIAPLLSAIQQRAYELGILTSTNSDIESRAQGT